MSENPQSDSTDLDSDDDIVELPPLAKHVDHEIFDPTYTTKNVGQVVCEDSSGKVNKNSRSLEELFIKETRSTVQDLKRNDNISKLVAYEISKHLNGKGYLEKVNHFGGNNIDKRIRLKHVNDEENTKCSNVDDKEKFKKIITSEKINDLQLLGRNDNFLSGPFTCDFCQTHLFNLYTVGRHMTNRHGIIDNINISCDSCTQDFPTDIEVMVHKQDDHGVCSVCNITLPSCDTLQQHLDTHTDPTLQRCLICGSGFQARVALLYHIKYKHANVCDEQAVFNTIYESALQSPESGVNVFHFKCPYCLSSYIDRQECYEHLKNHKTVRGIRCKLCREKFKHRKNLLEHLFKHSKSDTIQCDVCARQLTKGWIKQHSTCDKLILCCRRCGLAYENTSDLTNHMIKHLMKLELKCYKCHKTFINKLSFKKHGLLHEERQSYKCTICSITYIDERKLIIHYKEKHTHVKESEMFSCEQCSKKFNCKSSLSKHMATSHRPKTIKCQYCPKMFHSQVKAKRHETIHTGEKSYKCEICQKTFSQSSSLISHQITHSDFRACKCPECDKSFKTKSQLKYHMFTHTGERPFVCDICGRGFTNQTHRKTHMRTHTGETPYLCQHCGAGYLTNAQLQRHILSHTGEIPYLCQHCGASFPANAQLQKHVLKHQ